MLGDFKKHVLIGSILIAGSILFFGAGFYFFAKTLRAEADKIAQGRTLIAQNAVALTALAQLKEDLPTAERYEKTLLNLMVTKDQLLDFPRWLEGIARARQVGINFSFSGTEAAPQETYPGYISFSLNTVGNLDNSVAFLKDLETRSERFLVNLETFDLTRNESDYRINLRGRVFFR